MFLSQNRTLAVPTLEGYSEKSSLVLRLKPHICFFLGPLLPESLDVRDIPVSRGRELTIDLSGECCVNRISV